jgi:hypothetical protein
MHWIWVTPHVQLGNFDMKLYLFGVVVCLWLKYADVWCSTIVLVTSYMYSIMYMYLGRVSNTVSLGYKARVQLADTCSWLCVCVSTHGCLPLWSALGDQSTWTVPHPTFEPACTCSVDNDILRHTTRVPLRVIVDTPFSRWQHIRTSNNEISHIILFHFRFDFSRIIFARANILKSEKRRGGAWERGYKAWVLNTQSSLPVAPYPVIQQCQ